eukprot:UN17558
MFLIVRKIFEMNTVQSEVIIKITGLYIQLDSFFSRLSSPGTVVLNVATYLSLLS